LTPILILTAAILLLIISITYLRIHPFLALLIIGLFLGISTGMTTQTVLETLLDGFANTLKWIGIVMILGTVIGEILTETGGAFRISDSILTLVGKKRVPLTMGITGYIVAIPVFVDVAYIMLQPITESLAVKSKRNILVVGLSLTAGLTATHALLPPTPGPLAGAALLDANLGRVILINFFVAIFAVTGGLLWATLYCKKRELPYDRQLRQRFESKELQSHINELKVNIFGAFAPIFVPLILIALGSFAETDIRFLSTKALKILGTPTIALFIGIVIAAFLLKRNGRMQALHKILDRSIEKAAVVIMITAAGGAFGAVIKASDIGPSVSSAITETGLPGLLLPFILAAGLTTATGSLTVSMVTSASVVSPMLSTFNISPEIALALIGAGSLCVIHANSSFFWLLSRLHDVPPNELYRTFSIQSMTMGIGGLVGVFVLWLFGFR
jgi:GntP family gluconate:H+ symporter